MIIKEETYIKNRVKSYNKRVKKKALIEARAAAENKEAKNNLTENHEDVKAIWDKQTINEDSPEA